MSDLEKRAAWATWREFKRLREELRAAQGEFPAQVEAARAAMKEKSDE